MPVPKEQISSEIFMSKARSIGPSLSPQVNQEENYRKLSEPTVTALRDAGLYKLFLPMSLGGFETDPLTAAKVVEEIAGHNISAAWSLMAGNIPTWWCSRLTEKGVEEIFAGGPDTFIVSAFHPPMKAIVVDGGYRITGRSPLTSNVHEAEWIFVTALVTEGGEIKINNGLPEILGVFMKSDDWNILDTWHTRGMRATDSNDVEANDAYVPDHLTFPLVPELEHNTYYGGKLYRFPAIGANITSLIAPVALAIARKAIDEVKSLAEKKVPFGSAVSIRERGSVQRKLGMAEAFVQSSSAYLQSTLSKAWEKTIRGEKSSIEEKAGILLAATHTNQMCLQAVDLMYSASGTSGIYTRNNLSRYFADAQVLRQHGFVNDTRYETAAQVYLGLQPDLAVIVF